MSSCLNSCGLCGRAYHEPGRRRAGTRKSRAPSGVERVRVGVSISTKSWPPSTWRAAALTFRPQPDGGALLRAAQVEIAVLQASLLADGDALVDLERQRRRLTQHLESAHDHLDVTRGQLGVGVALGAQPHLAGDLDTELVAQLVRPTLGQHLVAGHHLGHPRRIPQVEEGDSAVISALRHPAGERDGLSGVLGAQRAGLVSAKHVRSFSVGVGRLPWAALEAAGQPTHPRGPVRTAYESMTSRRRPTRAAGC